MNKILVLFDSKSGNVAQMAALVAEGAGHVPDTFTEFHAQADAAQQNLRVARSSGLLGAASCDAELFPV